MADDAYKKLSFKDFLNVDYKPGEDELIKRNAKKRKMDTPTGNTGESYVPEAKANPSGAKVGDKFIYNDSTHVVTKVTPDSVHGKSKIGGARSFHHKHYQGFSKVKEDVDQLDELKAKTLTSYLKKSQDAQRSQSHKTDMHNRKGEWDKADKSFTKELKRLGGQHRAINSLAKKASRNEDVDVLENFIVSEAESIDEVLSYSARRKKARSLRKNKAKVQMGARKARRRMADRGRLKNRAQKQARNSMFLKLSKGVPRSDMPPARRAQIEKRLAMMGKRIERIAKRTLPKVRKMEIERKRSAKK